MYTHAILALATVLCAAALTPLAGQQAPDSASVVETSSAPASSPSTNPQGPRLSPQFQHFEPRLASSNASVGSPLAIEGGQNTIVISTLALVLGAVIIVLLVAN